MLDQQRVRMAYTELNEIIKHLSEKEYNRIPNIFITNMQNKMDKNYSFIFLENKSIVEQNLMPETKSMIVQIYKKYLCSESEKIGWKKYDSLCHEKIEKQKYEKYNPNDIFKKETIQQVEIEANEKQQMIEYKKETFIDKILNKFKTILLKFKHN